MSSQKPQDFTADECFIMDALHYVNAEKDNFIGVMLMLSEDEERSAIQKAKMVKYLKCKGKYITEQDILKKAHQITRKRERYYRPEIYVKYIGETTERLTKGDVYEVKAVYGCEEAFLLCCDDDSLQEVPAELVEWQNVTQIEYIGSEEENGEIIVAEGFELNKTYTVEPFYMGQYRCENGLSCWFYEANPISFQTATVSEPKPIEDIDAVLRLLRDAIEFGSAHNLARYLHPNCEYVAQSSNERLNTKIAIIKHFRESARRELADDVFCDCDLGVLEEVPENSVFPAGTHCVICCKETGVEVFVVTLNEERNYITDIYVFSKQYLHENNYKLNAYYQRNKSSQE